MERSDLWPAASPAELIRGYRHAAGLTQRELAVRAGLSVGAVRDLEQGRRRPRPDSLTRLAGALGLEAAQARDLAGAARGDEGPAGESVRSGTRSPAAGGLWLEVLGPLAAWRAGTTVVAGGPARRAVLGLLAVAGGSLVHREAIIDALWPDGPPPTAVNVVQAHVSALRRVLDPGRGPSGPGRLLASAGASYELRAGPGQLDLLAFRQLTARARAARSDEDNEAACRLYRQALALWRGEPLADVDLLRGHPAVTSLARQHTETVVEYARTATAAGWHDQVLAPLREAAGQESLNEQVHALLMVALAGSGQQAAALAVYDDLRRRLDKELGILPGIEVAQARQQVLRQDIPIPGPTRAAAGRVATEGQRQATPVEHQLAIPRQLPARVPHFTGREQELDILTAMLCQPGDETPQTVVISAIGGTAGVGKTALALAWAHQVADRVPDGQLYVNLRGYDPGTPLSAGEVLAGFLRSLGVPGQDVPAGDDERAALYRSMLAGRQMLVVLDNAHDADQVRPLLPGTPGCVVAVTSRDQLAGLVARDGARRLDLDVLPLSDAVRLLRRLIGGRVEAEPEAAATLAAQCCRLPLAVRVAAEMAVARPGASLASLASELGDQRQRLDLLDAGGDPSTAVRAVFSWSVRHLNSDTARAFRLAGVHPGPDLDARAAAALTGTSLEHAGGLLKQLTRAHLIQGSGAGRYVMHDLLSDYARELAAEHGGDEQPAALTRLLDYYLHAAVAAMDALYPAEKGQRPDSLAAVTTVTWLTEPDTARAWLAAELRCLVAAIEHAAAHGWHEHAIRLAATIFRYLDPSGHLSEAIAVHQSALSAARHRSDIAAEAMALSNLATAELRRGRDQEAARYLRQALALSRRTADRTSEARALGNLGVLAFWQGRYGQAADYYERALDLHRQTGNHAGEVTGLCNLAGAHIRQRRYEEAAGYLQQALALSRGIGNRDGEAYALLNLGDINLQQGRYKLAGPCLRQSLALSRQLGDRAGEAAALSGLGQLDLQQGRYQHAARQLHKALTLSRAAGARSSEIDALHLLGEVSLATGDSRQAHIHHAAALAQANDAGDIDLQARAHAGLARADEAAGDAQQARHHWQQALIHYTKLGAPEADQARSRLNTLRAD